MDQGQEEKLRELSEQYASGKVTRREFMGRGIALGFSLATLSPLLAMAGQASASSKRVAQITFMKPPHISDDRSIQEHIIAVFERSHPNIKVNFTSYNWATMNAQLDAIYAAPNPPDVAYLTDEVYPKFAQAGALEPLNTYVDEASFRHDRAEYFPFPWKLGHYFGKQYGLPVLAACYVLYYNRDLLAKAHLKTVPDTREAFLAAAEKLTKRGEVWGVTVRQRLADFAFWDWFPYLHDAGANILTSDQKAAALNTPAAAAGTQFLADLQFKYKVAPPVGLYDWNGDIALFEGGKAAMQYGDTTEIVTLQKKPPPFKWDIAMSPRGPKGQTVMGNYGFLCMSSKSKNKEAAWEFIKFYQQPRIIEPYAEEITLQVCRKDATRNIYAGNPVMRKVQDEFVPKIEGLQANPHMAEILDSIWPEIVACYAGQQTAAEALSKAAQLINGIIA